MFEPEDDLALAALGFLRHSVDYQTTLLDAVVTLAVDAHLSVDAEDAPIHSRSEMLRRFETLLDTADARTPTICVLVRREDGWAGVIWSGEETRSEYRTTHHDQETTSGPDPSPGPEEVRDPPEPERAA